MSSKNKGKPMFPNRRSAVTSIAVVLLLLVFGVIVIDQNNVSRLKRYRADALVSLDKAMEAMDERFMYSQTLVGLLEDDALAKPLLAVFETYTDNLSPQVLSNLYIVLDKELSLLQKKIFTSVQYPLYAAYFEKIYEAERMMATHLERYNDNALFYTTQKEGFLASIAAKRLEMEPLELFSVAPALKGRP